MNWKKLPLYVVLVLLVLTGGFAVMANRDLERMYGGLTERVDSSPFKPVSGPLVISNVNVLSPDAQRFIGGQTVVVDNGTIKSVNNQLVASEQMHAINGEGKYLIPGLIDSHVHLFKSPNDLLLYVANGVTQVREMIGEPDHLAWRDELGEGRIGPDMFIASPRIGSFGYIEGMFMEWSQGFLNLSNASEARDAVEKFSEQGYDAVKIYSQVNNETYRAVTDEARSAGMRVVGHVPWSVEIADLYTEQEEVAHLEEIMNAMNREFGDYGYDNTEEFLAFVKKRSDDIAWDLREHGVAVTTTLWLVESFVRQKMDIDGVLKEVEFEYENPGISEWSKMAGRGIGWLPDVNRYKWPDDITEIRKTKSIKYWETYAKACQLVLQSLVKNGVKIFAGTDANLPPTVPGFSLHDELISMNKAGMTPSQVLASATALPAEWLRINAGTIAPGQKANMVLLDRNPLDDIRNTSSIDAVVLNGQLFDRPQLDKMLAAVKIANNASRRLDISRYLD